MKNRLVERVAKQKNETLFEHEKDRCEIVAAFAICQ
jgi:hypothetical protein